MLSLYELHDQFSPTSSNSEGIQYISPLTLYFQLGESHPASHSPSIGYPIWERPIFESAMVTRNMQWFLMLYIFLLGPAGLGLLQGQPLFEQESPLPIIMYADWPVFFADRSDSAEYYPAHLLYYTEADTQQVHLRIRARGNFRRKSSVCAIQPIRLRFRKAERTGNIFHDHKKLKLVSNCQGDLYVVREYLAYKIYQVFSDISYQVRLVDMTYRHRSPMEDPDLKHLSFVIEDEDRLAERLTASLQEHINPPDSALDPAAFIRMALFQYVIGNMDWDPYMEKNLSYLQYAENEPLIPVPYDFDWSGLVDAPYTMLPEDFERREVRQVSQDSTLCQQVWQEVLLLEDAVDECLKDFPYLPKAERRLLRQYCRLSFRMMRKKDFWQGLLISSRALSIPE